MRSWQGPSWLLLEDDLVRRWHNDFATGSLGLCDLEFGESPSSNLARAGSRQKNGEGSMARSDPSEMTAQRWRTIEAIFNHASELFDRSERDAYLAEQCANDPQMRAEIDSLLEADAAPDTSVRSMMDIGIRTRDDAQTIARSIGPYKILQRMGAGGMGVVYKALDTRLERRVRDKATRRARVYASGEAAILQRS